MLLSLNGSLGGGGGGGVAAYLTLAGWADTLIFSTKLLLVHHEAIHIEYA